MNHEVHYAALDLAELVRGHAEVVNVMRQEITRQRQEDREAAGEYQCSRASGEQRAAIAKPTGEEPLVGM